MSARTTLPEYMQRELVLGFLVASLHPSFSPANTNRPHDTESERGDRRKRIAAVSIVSSGESFLLPSLAMAAMFITRT